MTTIVFKVFGRYPRHTIHFQWRWPFIRHHLGGCICGINEILKR